MLLFRPVPRFQLDQPKRLLGRALFHAGFFGAFDDTFLGDEHVLVLGDAISALQLKTRAPFAPFALRTINTEAVQTTMPS